MPKAVQTASDGATKGGRVATTRQVQTKSKKAEVKLTPDQYEMIVKRAERCGIRLTTWMRSILMQAAASRAANDGYIRIREPDRTTV